MKKPIIFIFVFLVLCSFAYAVPPVTQVQQFTAGYVIEDTPQTILKLNTDFQYNFFVFNLSNGMLLTNSSLDCIHYIADSTGSVLFFDEVPYFEADGHWGITLMGSNFSSTGYYAYGTKCNSTMYGGAATGLWQVTTDGQDENTDATSGISITIFILLVTVLLFYIGISDKRLTRAEISNVILKRAAIVIALYLMVMNTSILMTISQGAFDILPELNRYMWLFGYAGYLFMAFMVLKTLFDVAKMWNISKRKKRMGEEEDEY